MTIERVICIGDELYRDAETRAERHEALFSDAPIHRTRDDGNRWQMGGRFEF